MPYIDGYVIPVKSTDRDKFAQHASRMDQFFLDHGALRIIENWGDDVPDGKQTDFKRAVQAKNDETVVFSWIEWPDKGTRDAAMKAMQGNQQMMNEPMPFDGKRMIFGGFEPVVQLGRKLGGA